MRNIRLVLVDNHDLMRTTLKFFLDSQEGLEVVGMASDRDEVIELIKKTIPDVILIDITLADMNVTQTIRQLKLNSPESRILALTSQPDKQLFFETMEAGAAGYLTRDAATEELVAAIHSIAEGYVYLQPVLARWLLEDYQRLLDHASQINIEKPEDVEIKIEEEISLSIREHEVLKMITQGYSNFQIGSQLGISPKTVARHRERMMKKLNIHSSVELVKFALRRKIISL
jgi:DNA-binding NarL/FixJ family response regulator